jgi:ABC-type transport system involved in cytochrome c biogenesis permease subunit
MLNDLLLYIHLFFLFTSDALLIVTGILSILYLYKNSALKNKSISSLFTILPSIEDLDKTNFLLLLFGVSSMILGIITGGLLAEKSWQGYWYFDPKIICTSLTIMVFSTLFSLRVFFGFRGRKASILTLIGVSLVIIGFSIIKIFPNTQHKNFYYEH